MTEAEWLTCEEPGRMLRFLKEVMSDRKLRLYGCGCVRRAWQVLPNPISEDERGAVEATERYVDGIASPAEQSQFQRQAYRGGTSIDLVVWIDARADIAVGYWQSTMGMRAAVAGCLADPALNASDDGFTAAWNAWSAGDCPILRCIFGNPIRPVAVDPAWLTSTVVQLAQGIYDDRAFDRLPILADALQDAGCDNDDVLNHCRGDSPHARGCWVVDLVLGKC